MSFEGSGGGVTKSDGRWQSSKQRVQPQSWLPPSLHICTNSKLSLLVLLLHSLFTFFHFCLPSYVIRCTAPCL